MTKFSPVVVVKSGGGESKIQDDLLQDLVPPEDYLTPELKHRRPSRRWCTFLIVLPVLLLLLIPLPFLSDLTPYTQSFTGTMAESKLAPLTLDDSLNKFTTDLYQVLAKASPGQNLFFSPFSIMTALSMTLVGARSNTYDQLAKVLGFQHPPEQIIEAFSEVIKKYQEVVPDYELRTANMMYSSHLLGMQQDFSDTLTKKFRASAKTVDFGGQTEAVRAEINAAVEKETNKKIKDLIPQGVLDELTRMVLVNAIYFKGLWVTPFEKRMTLDKPFWVSEDSSVQVPMMHLKSDFLYSVNKELKASILSMDYKGSNLSMVIVLPDKRMGLSEVESKLSSVDLRTLASEGRKTKVEVDLPRFKLEVSKELVPVLEEMGAPDLVTVGKCDLSGVGGKPGDLFVSNVLHKAFIEVNEEGTEAAAATAVVMGLRCVRLPQPPTVFVADHPFLFFIYESGSSHLLFAGRYCAPQ